jgi:hypothetical protein
MLPSLTIRCMSGDPKATLLSIVHRALLTGRGFSTFMRGGCTSSREVLCTLTYYIQYSTTGVLLLRAASQL